jgi:hypothetical protein
MYIIFLGLLALALVCTHSVSLLASIVSKGLLTLAHCVSHQANQIYLHLLTVTIKNIQ